MHTPTSCALDSTLTRAHLGRQETERERTVHRLRVERRQVQREAYAHDAGQYCLATRHLPLAPSPPPRACV